MSPSPTIGAPDSSPQSRPVQRRPERRKGAALPRLNREQHQATVARLAHRVQRMRLIDDNQGLCLLTDSGTRVHPRRVSGRDDRHLIMVFSDCVGKPWYRDALWQTIRDWCRRGPVVLVQPLPARLWESTALGPAAARVEQPPTGPTQQQVRIIEPWWSIGDDNPGGAVPVVGLTEMDLARWARMVMGSANVLVPAVFTEVERDDPPPPLTLSADKRVAMFKATVSVEAYQLAVCLAALPIRLPIARIVQYAVVGTRDPVHHCGGLRERTDTSRDTHWRRAARRRRLRVLARRPRAATAITDR